MTTFLFLMVVALVVAAYYFATRTPKLGLAKIEFMVESGKSAGKNVKEGMYWLLKGAEAVGAEVTVFDELATEKTAEAEAKTSYTTIAAEAIKAASAEAEELKRQAEAVVKEAEEKAERLKTKAGVAENRVAALTELENLLK